MAVRPGVLHCGLRIINTGDVALPAAPGWHPYVTLPLEEKSALRLDAGPGYRAPAGPEGALDDVLPLPRQPLHVAWPSGELRMTTSDHFGGLVVYTAPGQPLVCIEPWVAPPNSLNDPTARLSIGPGRTFTLWMEIAVL